MKALECDIVPLYVDWGTLVLLSMLLMSLACDAIALGSNQVEVEAILCSLKVSFYL
jgi:hypothetical protein